MQAFQTKIIQKVVVLGTGGTIAGTATDASDNIGYTAAQLGVAHLVNAIPELGALQKAQGFELVCEQVAQLDSKDMSQAVWQLLLERVAFWLAQGDVSGVVVTHGTDTLEETAFLLHRLLSPALVATKPVVLTCAMRPATALNSDGPQNLLDAVRLATRAEACGVMVVCAGAVHSGLDVQKIHPYRLDAFGSGDAGALGWMEEGRFRQVRAWPVGTLLSQGSDSAKWAWAMAQRPWPRVEIVLSHAGASGWVVDALMAQSATGQVAILRGIVVAGTGNGSLHADLQAALLEAQTRGVSVRRATRCATGQVLAMPADLIADSQGLSAVKARIALMLELLADSAA